MTRPLNITFLPERERERLRALLDFGGPHVGSDPARAATFVRENLMIDTHDGKQQCDITGCSEDATVLTTAGKFCRRCAEHNGYLTRTYHQDAQSWMRPGLRATKNGDL